MSDLTPVQTVTAFFEAFGSFAEVRAAYEKFLSDDCVWINPGMPTCEGKAQILALLDGSHETLKLQATPVDLLHVGAGDGGVVFAERIDHLIGEGGKLLFDLPVAGVLEVSDGFITAWREYADPTPFASILNPS